MRLRGLAIIAAAMLLLPTASAGWAREPEIEDEREPRMAPYLDVVRAWIVPDAQGVRFFIEAAEGARSDTVYYFLFHVESTDDEVGGAVGYGNDGVLRTHLLENGMRDLRGLIGPGFEKLANDGLLSADRDGTVLSATIPWGVASGFVEGAELHGLTAGTVFFARGGSGWQPGDQAATDDLVVASIPSPLSRATAGLLPILVPAWVLPFIVLGATLAGAAGGFAVARRVPAPAEAPPPTRVQVRPPPPPPGQRFRAAPPPRTP